MKRGGSIESGSEKRAREPAARELRRRVAGKRRNPILQLADDLRAIGMSVPKEEWEKLPPDFNENLDHYLYGSPKKIPTRLRGERLLPADRQADDSHARAGDTERPTPSDKKR